MKEQIKRRLASIEKKIDCSAKGHNFQTYQKISEYGLGYHMRCAKCGVNISISGDEYRSRRLEEIKEKLGSLKEEQSRIKEEISKRLES
jgi:tetrahydromethanopterin S-methyltransferase subunit G